jgi:steroid delta-isomerase-like uncharacterized protein
MANVNKIQLFESYTEGWNDHDPATVADQFAENGTYVDPNVGEKLQGEEIAEYVAGTIEGFPDVHFEEHRIMQTDIEGEFGLVVEWTMHGAHTGPLEGLPPTGNTIVLDGVDVVTISENGIVSIRGYFDQKEFAQQLGLTFPAIIGQLPTLAVGAAKQTLES